MVGFGETKSFLDINLAYNYLCFEIFATNTAKVRMSFLYNSWNVNKIRVFLVFKGLHENVLICANFPLNVLEPPIYLVLKNISNCSKNCCFCSRNPEVTCFKIDFKIDDILKIFDLFAKSKYFFNQSISTDSRNSGNFRGAIFFKNESLKKWQMLTNEIAN